MQPQKGSLWRLPAVPHQMAAEVCFQVAQQESCGFDSQCERWIGVFSLCGRSFAPGTLTPTVHRQDCQPMIRWWWWHNHLASVTIFILMMVYQNKSCFQAETDGLLTVRVQATSTETEDHASGHSGCIGRCFADMGYLKFSLKWMSLVDMVAQKKKVFSHPQNKNDSSFFFLHFQIY